MNWFKKISSRIVPMSPAQLSWANWALDGMWQYWSTEQGAYDRDGELYDESQLPQVQGNSLILSDVQEINEDLLYRLEELAYDVAEQDFNASDQQLAGHRRAAISLANNSA